MAVTLERAERTLMIAILFVFVIMMFYLFQNSMHRFVKEGELIPPFKIFDVQQKSYSNNDFQGKVVLINFWTSWCPPCVEEMPSLVEFDKKYKGKGVAVLLINVNESLESINKFLKKNNFDSAVYRDVSGEMAKEFGTFKFPESFLVDKKGILRKKIIGELNWMEDNVTNYVEGLLNEK